MVVLAHPRVQQLDALTSLRFVAALFVVYFHYSTLFFGHSAALPAASLGYTGVTFFFLLSGFILSYNYRSVDFTNQQDIHNYLVARFARIYPAFLASLLISLPFFIKAITQIDGPAQQLLGASGLILAPLGLHAWVPGAACSLNCPSWSVSTEFFFYLVFPFVLLKILRRPTAWLVTTLLCWAAMVCFLGVVWSLYGQGFSLTGYEAHNNPSTNLLSQFIMYFPLVRLPEFLFGILLFVYWSTNRTIIKPQVLIAAFAVLALAFTVLEPSISDVALHNGLTAIVWAPLILAGASMQRGLLNWAPLVFLGRISFSFYLLHIPAAQTVLAVNKYLLGGKISSFPWLWALGTTALAIALSVAMYALIESPGRRYVMSRWSETLARARETVAAR